MPALGAIPGAYQNPSGFNIPGASLGMPTSPMVSGSKNPWTANTLGMDSNSIPNFGGGKAGDPLGLGLDSSVIGGLTNTFGEGEGNALYNFLAHGAGYNPKVANALISQMQPNIERGLASLQEMYGSTGNYGSPSALAEGDFMSQAALGENSILANLYNDAVNRYYGVISNAMGPSANSGGPGIGNILGAASGGVSDISSILSSLGVSGGLSGIAGMLGIGGGGAAAGGSSLAGIIGSLLGML